MRQCKVFHAPRNKTEEPSQPYNRQELLDHMKMDANRPINKPIPLNYTNGFVFAGLGIPFNGGGWNSEMGNTKSCVVLYVENPECLILDVTLTNGTELPVSAFDCIRAKIGIEFLKRESIAPTSKGVRIEFSGPTRKIYQTGIQQASIALVAPKDLSELDSQFRLLKVSWHQSPANSPP